jgi:hypothetical protein
MASLAEYHTALSAFAASPSEGTKAAVLAARAALPDQVSGDGGSASLPNLSTLETTLSATLAGMAKASAGRRRFIQTGLSHGC